MGRMTHSPIQGRQLVLILGLVFVGTLVLPPLAAWRLNQHRIDETISTARAAAASVAPRIAALALAHPDIEVAVGPGLLPASGEGGQATWIEHAVFASEVFGEQIKKLFPVIAENQSDSACLDNMFELLVAACNPDDYDTDATTLEEAVRQGRANLVAAD